MSIGTVSAASSIFNMSPTTNTIYQNTNSIPLTIYADDKSSFLIGWIGSSPASLTKVIYSNFTLISTISLVYNNTETMVVPKNWYYKFNYSKANFKGELVDYNYTQTQVFLSIPPLSAPQYASAAEIAFAVGSFLFILTLLIVFDIIKLRRSLIGAIAGLSIAFICVISLVFGMIYTDTFTQQAYTITVYNQTMNVASASITTMPLVSNAIIRLLGESMTFMALISGLVYFFLALFVYKNDRKEKKYR